MTLAFPTRRASDLELAFHVGQLDADRLVADERLAEGFPILRPFGGLGHRDAGIGAAAHRHAEPFAIEIAHDADEAAILRADEVFGRHAHIGDIERGGSAAPPDTLVEPSTLSPGTAHGD